HFFRLASYLIASGVDIHTPAYHAARLPIQIAIDTKESGLLHLLLQAHPYDERTFEAAKAALGNISDNVKDPNLLKVRNVLISYVDPIVTEALFGDIKNAATNI